MDGSKYLALFGLVFVSPFPENTKKLLWLTIFELGFGIFFRKITREDITRIFLKFQKLFSFKNEPKYENDDYFLFTKTDSEKCVKLILDKPNRAPFANLQWRQLYI